MPDMIGYEGGRQAIGALPAADIVLVPAVILVLILHIRIRACLK